MALEAMIMASILPPLKLKNEYAHLRMHKMKKVKNVNKLFLLVIIYFILASYIGVGNNPKRIHLETDQKPVNLVGDLFTLDRVIPLETTPDNLIGTILKLQVKNDTMYIFSPKTVMLFRITGEYIGSVGKIGNGPGEMVLPFDFSVHPNGGQVAMLDNVKEEVFFYNNNGKFISSQKTGLSYIAHFTWYKPDLFIFNSNFKSQGEKNFSVYLSDFKKNTSRGFLDFDPMVNGIFLMNHCQYPQYRGNQFITRDFDNTVYKLGSGDIPAPYINITFDSGTIQQADLLKFSGRPYDFIDWKNKNKKCNLGNFNEFDSYYAITYFKGNLKHTQIISKKKGEHYKINHSANLGDPISEFLPVWAYKEYLIMVAEPFVLKQKIKQIPPTIKAKLGKNYEALLKIANQVNDEDNPIIIFLSYKSE
jgi:hypothetical protein